MHTVFLPTDDDFLIFFQRPKVDLKVQEEPILSKFRKQKKASPGPSKRKPSPSSPPPSPQKKKRVKKSKPVISDSDDSGYVCHNVSVLKFADMQYSDIHLGGEEVPNKEDVKPKIKAFTPKAQVLPVK